MDEIGISHRPKRKPNGISKADKEARKSDDLIKRNFTSNKPLVKCVTDMTEINVRMENYMYLQYLMALIQQFLD